MIRTLRVGLTGGIGSGKSTACKIFTELGVPVIDADHIAHQLIGKDGAAYPAIRSLFGNKVIMDNGEIDRSLLRDMVFDNSETRKKLENILHPLVFSEIESQVAGLDRPYCIISIPLLAETNTMDKVDRILVIDTPVETQIERAAKRDNCTKENISKIIESQAAREQRLKIADDIINNNSDINSLRDKILLLHEKYKQIVNHKLNPPDSSN